MRNFNICKLLNREAYVKERINQSKDHLVKTTIGVSLIVILGKLLGFGRETLIAAYYGATAETDAFFFAQSMPAMIFPAVCNSLSTAFLSLYVKRTTEMGEENGERYASRMLLSTSLLGIVLSGIGVLLVPLLVPLMAPGFSDEQLMLAIYLSQLNMGAFILGIPQYMLSAILNAKHLFIGSQVASLFYNATIIFLTLILGRGQNMVILTLVVILGLGMQLGVLVLCCIGHFRPSFQLFGYRKDIFQLLRMALPILLGNSVIQINTIVDKALSSTLPDGSLSALSYGNTLSFFVTSVFITSLSTVLYPTLTTDAAKGDLKQYGKTLLNSLHGLTLILIPISCISLLDAEDIVDTVYAHGSFDQTAVAYTSVVLACYAPMFLFSGIREVLTRGFFAMQDTKTPMRNSAIGVCCNILFSLLFVRWLGLAGIALGTTLSALTTAVLLLSDAKKQLPSFPLFSYFQKLLHSLTAGAIMVFALLLFHRVVFIPYAIARFIADTLVGFSVYLFTLYVTRCKISNRPR